MSMQEILAGMADIADRLEYEGAEIIAARADRIVEPRLHLWGESLPDVVRERGDIIGWYGRQHKVGYVEDGVTVFWLEA